LNKSFGFFTRLFYDRRLVRCLYWEHRVDDHVVHISAVLHYSGGSLEGLILDCYFETMNAQIGWHVHTLTQVLADELSVLTRREITSVQTTELYWPEYERSRHLIAEGFCEVNRFEQVKFSLWRGLHLVLLFLFINSGYLLLTYLLIGFLL
jgi:hypothetical protein